MFQRRKRGSLFLTTFLMGLIALLPACGGGGGSSSEGSPSAGTPSMTTVGVAVDPYIVGAVFEEIPAAGGDAIQESAPSDSRGEFVFALPLTPGSTLRMKEGAQGMHNGAPYRSILKKRVNDDGVQVVSPLTTLLANGVSGEDVLNALADAGLPGLQIADLHADPMARLESSSVLTSESLRLLQANIAVNNFFTLRGNSDAGASDLTSRREELVQMVDLARTTVAKESFDAILSSGAVLLSSERALSRDHALRALVSIVETVVAQKVADPAVDPVASARELLSKATDLALIYYVQDNRGDLSVEEGINAGTLPDVQQGDTAYLELAKWKWKSAPVAHAGADQSVTTGTLVTLDGSRSTDPDNRDRLTYQWSFSTRPSGSKAALTGATTVNPTFTPDVAGSYQVKLTVYDQWGGVSAPSTVTVTAADSVVSAPGVIQFSSSAYSVAENAGKIDITIQRVHGSTGSVSVEWRTRTYDGYGTADWSKDYGTVDWSTITFAAGETSKVVTVQIHDNATVEGDKTFSLLLQNPTGGAVLGTPGSAVVTIADNDTAAEPAPAPAPEPSPEPTPAPTPAPEPEPAPAPSGPLKAVPDVVGFGVETPGGRGGVVIRVNTLSDNNNALTLNADGTRSGSLRSALNYNGKRIIVFEVSGRINLTSELVVTRPFVTIAGQTAPAPGITLYGNAFRIATNDVVMQHIRVRANNSTTAQLNGPLGIQDYNNNIWNVVIDRCVFGWGADENVAIWASSGRSINDVTVSNSIVHESTRPSSSQDSYGMIFGDRVKRIMSTGNLLVSNRTRNPLYKGGSEAIFANNIAYNAALGAFVLFSDDYRSGAVKASVVNNIFKRGPSGSPSELAWFSADTAGKGFQVYQAGNISKAANGSSLNLPWGNTAPSGVMVSSPPIWINGFSPIAASNLEATLLPKVGARAAERTTSYRDANDVRLINEYQTGTGAIPASGYLFPVPSINGQNRAFQLPANPNGVSSSGYTNIEDVLHKMARDIQ